MTRKEKRALKKSKSILKELVKVIKNINPNFFKEIDKLEDPRNKGYIIYEQSVIVLVMILAHMCACGSMNDMTYKFNKENVIENVNKILGTNYEELPHGDTINDYLKELNVSELEKIETNLIKRLIRMKALDKYRLNGKFLVAIDGTGLHSFAEDPGKHALKAVRTKEDGTTAEIYYYKALEAKLIVGDMALSLATEFIENEDKNVTKQDCEIKAFSRIIKKIKERFPKQKLVILGDALYVSENVFEQCIERDWDYIIRFKEGAAKDKYSSYEETANTYLVSEEKEDEIIMEEYKYSNEVRYKKDKYKKKEKIKEFLSACGCENSKDKKKYVFITNIKITKKNVKEIIKAGRKRWKIENQGFKQQKRCGFELEHLFSENYNAMKNHYMIIQISHLFFQLFREIKKEICANTLKQSMAEIFESLSSIMILDEIKKDAIENEKILIE